MIEILSAERCIACDICVKACPANVFEAVIDDKPVIARQQDCQTCFLCEVYCPVDALYVSPVAEPADVPAEADLALGDLLGSYARALGWRKGKPGGSDQDPTYRLSGFV